MGQTSLTELGCMLGAFRDVAVGIGMDVMAVTLIARKHDAPPPKPPSPAECALPKGKSRNVLKLMALIQTFSDSIYHVGYVLDKVDMRHVEPGRPGIKKMWSMRVTIGDREELITGEGAAANRGQNTGPGK